MIMTVNKPLGLKGLAVLVMAHGLLYRRQPAGGSGSQPAAAAASRRQRQPAGGGGGEPVPAHDLDGLGRVR